MGASERHDERASIDELFDLAYRGLELKDERRGGWVIRGVEDPESVADHSWGTALLCLLFAPAAGVDRDLAVSMAVLHDLAEIETGDIVARADDRDREVSVTDKARLELEAIQHLLPPFATSLRELWLAYERREGPVATFVRDMNLIDMCLQALYYQERSRTNPSHRLASRGGFDGLDEFFAAAGPKLHSQLARELFARAQSRYSSLIRGSSGPLS